MAFKILSYLTNNSSLTLPSPSAWGDFLGLRHATISPSLVSNKFSFDLSALLVCLFQWDSATMISFSSPSLFQPLLELWYLTLLPLFSETPLWEHGHSLPREGRCYCSGFGTTSSLAILGSLFWKNYHTDTNSWKSIKSESFSGPLWTSSPKQNNPP